MICGNWRAARFVANVSSVDGVTRLVGRVVHETVLLAVVGPEVFWQAAVMNVGLGLTWALLQPSIEGHTSDADIGIEIPADRDNANPSQPVQAQFGAGTVGLE